MSHATFDSANIIRSPTLRLPYRLVQPLVERAIGWPRLREIYEAAHVGSDGSAGAFCERVLGELGVSWSIADEDRARLASVDGPLVIAANHPFGGIDALSLFSLVAQLRDTSWSCISNRFLTGIPELAPHCLLVDPIGQPSGNRRTLATILRNLKAGGSLCLFPAARVSPRSEELGAVCDLPWSDHAARLAAASGAHLALIHIAGQNSERFLAIDPKKLLRRTFALVRELATPRANHVQLNLSALLPPAEVKRIDAAPNSGERLHALCYGGAERRPIAVAQAEVRLSARSRVPIAGVGSTTPLLEKAGFELLRFRGDEQPELLEALGRAREITFRAAGQGTGKEVDVSPEDGYYNHLVIRDQASGDLVGAYRLGLTEQILAEHGPDGLYLDHVFDIDPAFYTKVGPAMELSRSFVMPEYQRDSRALALLWKGLGATATEFGCRNLFGSVTISDDFEPASRAVLAAHLAAEHSDSDEIRKLVKARVPFEPKSRYHVLINRAWKGEPATALWPVVKEIERGRRTPPPLVKYYLSLGAKFIDFHVEAAFGNALYCLLRVDLGAIPKRYRERFL